MTSSGATWGLLTRLLESAVPVVDPEARDRALDVLRTRAPAEELDLEEVAVDALRTIVARRARRAPTDRALVALLARLHDLADEVVLTTYAQRGELIVSLWLRADLGELLGFHVGTDRRDASASEGASTSVADGIRAHMPVTVRRVEVVDPSVSWGGEGWSLSLLCPWVARGPASEFSWESETLEDDAWELVGHDLVDVEIGDDLVDPIFHFSGGWTVRIEADSDLDPWALHLAGLVIVGRAEPTRARRDAAIRRRRDNLTAAVHHDNDRPLDEAVVAWTGHGRSSWPEPDEQRIPAPLVAEVLALWRDYEATDAGHLEGDFDAMCDRARADFERLHPEVGVGAVVALDWLWSFRHR